MEVDGERLTPLDYAVIGQHQELAQLLIEHGALSISAVQDLAAICIQKVSAVQDLAAICIQKVSAVQDLAAICIQKVCLQTLCLHTWKYMCIAH